MKRFNLSWSLCALTLLAAAPTAAQALPADRTISYTIYDDPYNATPVALYVVELDLSASSSSGDDVGWEVTELRIIQVDGGDTVWTDTTPTVYTADGLWWISHADGNTPTLAEFDKLPLTDGTATPDVPTEDDMDFDFTGATFTGGNAPFSVTTSLSFKLQKDGDPQPELEADDLPAELDDEPL